MDEQQRLKTLIDYKILDTDPEKELDELADIAALMCDTPISLITMLDKERQWFKSNKGVAIKETPIEHSFCQHTLHNSREILVINDLSKDSRFNDNPLVHGQPYIRFYAGAPLETPEGFILGTLCVVDDKPRELSVNAQKALQLLAKKVMDYLNTRKVILDQKENIELNVLKLKNLTDQAPGVIYQFERTKEGAMSFKFISNGITALHPGLNPELLKRSPESLFSVIHPDDLPGVQLSIRESFENLHEWKMAFRVVCGDKIEWHKGRANAEKLSGDTVVWYGTFQNITNRIEYEKAMEQIAFDISHVLRRPVATLLGLTKLIRKEKALASKEINEFIGHVQLVSEELESYTRKLTETYFLKQEIIAGNKHV